MKKLFSGFWFRLSLLLALLSALLHALHLLIFRDGHHMAIYLFGDIAFVPLEVLLVSVIIHRLLEQRSKKERLNKMNMLIGVFFTETGNELLQMIAEGDQNRNDTAKRLSVSATWDRKDFQNALTGNSPEISINHDLIQDILTLLRNKRGGITSLLQNPVLLEHQEFTDLIWAILHLLEELEYRPELEKSLDNEMDRKHLKIDTERVYRALLGQWLLYMAHLKTDYPHLFSLAQRTLPLNRIQDATVS